MSHARPSVLWFPFTLSILFVLFRSRNIIKKFEWSKKMKLVEQVQIFFVSCFSRLQVFLISLGLVTVYKAMPYTVVGRQQPRIVFFFSHRFKTCVCAGREREIPVPIWCSLRAEMRGACGIHPYICVYWTCVCGFDWAMGEERGRRATETDGTQDTDTTETVERRLVTSRRVNYECVFASLSVRLFFQSSQINKRKRKERKKERSGGHLSKMGSRRGHTILRSCWLLLLCCC